MYKRLAEYGFINMITPATTNLAVVGDYYQIQGTFNTSAMSCGHFTVASDGSLTYSGEGGVFLVIGTSDVSVDKNCKINYTLFLDEVADGTTPHDFGAANKNENISINGLIELEKGVVLTARAKSDTINTVLSPANLNLTFVRLEAK